jgi:hypothetical protein
MTATDRENAIAAEAVAAGMAAAAAHDTTALVVHDATGSAVTVESVSGPDDHAVSWSQVDSAAKPTLIPSTPPTDAA